MTGFLAFSDHLAAITEATARFVEDSRAAGGAARVPATPDWDVADLVAHQGTVHRWAAGVVHDGLTSLDGRAEEHVAAAERHAPANFATRLDWLSHGAAQLVEELREAPEDLKAMVFLKSAPAPRQFWARRQAHETTIHRIDALSARLEHLPTTAQADLSPEFAADGVDELLTGFVPRKSTKLHSEEPIRVLVAATDIEAEWLLTISRLPPVTTRESTAEPDARITGTAAGLYLGLWNRGDDLAESGMSDVMGLWRDKVRISWR